MVCQQAVTSLVGALALLIGRGWRPSWCFDKATVKSLLTLGVPLTASTLVLIARYRLFAILIGGSAGAAVLGQVHIAFRLVDTVRDLTFTALWRLMLPALSEHQHDRAAMLTEVDRWLRRSACVIVPLCLALPVMLTQVVEVIMGPKWAAAGQAAIPLVGLMALSALMFPSGGGPGRRRTGEAHSLRQHGLDAAGMRRRRPVPPRRSPTCRDGLVRTQLLVFPYAMWVNARALGVNMLRPLSGGLSPTCAKG